MVGPNIKQQYRLHMSSFDAQLIKRFSYSMHHNGASAFGENSFFNWPLNTFGFKLLGRNWFKEARVGKILC